MTWNIETFLAECARSSQAAYDSFKTLLDQLESVQFRKEARKFLNEIIFKCEAEDAELFLKKYYFSIEKLAIAQSDDEEHILHLFQIPSVFAPEDWSFTFFEGLSRYPQTEFYGRTVVELGTGNGWISLVLAKKNLPSKIYGLDINPKAVVCARINLFINGLNNSGEEILDAEGKSLLQRVVFAESNLLEYCKNQNIVPDRVIGCIPQVLNPDESFAKTIAPENASDEYLYSLSNYTAQQGYIEDQFGLGLIAKAIEDSATLCKPGYKLIFNLGGRPGSAVLQRMFERRGFDVKKIWETRVFQAPDTDISSLVEIENNSLHRFEFFMSLNASEPINAQTAKAYQDSGGTIAHALGVYEATTDYHMPVKKILTALKDNIFKEARSGLDLSFDDKLLEEEKISFLADLTERITNNSWLYGDTRGDINLRRRIAEFLRSYFHIPLSAKSFLITPSRQAFVKNFLWLYKPTLAIVEKSFMSSVPKEWHNGKENSVLEGPHQVDLMCKLIESLRPQCVVTKLQLSDTKNPDGFIRLAEMCKRAGTHLAIDISDELDLSSSPKSNGIFATLAEKALDEHVTLFCGLVKNKVYSDLEVCFVVSENTTTLRNLEFAAELTYSRVPHLNQFYYDKLLFRLLNFQIKNLRREKPNGAQGLQLRLPTEPRTNYFKDFIKIHSDAEAAFCMPAIQGNQIPLTPKTLRLDYGENELAVAGDIKLHIFESFLRQNITQVESDPSNEVAALIQARYGIGRLHNDNFIYAGGVAPLFAGIAQQASLEARKILVPHGFYGYFLAAATFFGAEISLVKTDESTAFKITPSAIEQQRNSILFLNAPIVNPTGAIYSQNEIAAILDVCVRNNILVVLDTSFNGLQHLENKSTYKIENGLNNICILGGLSKEFATGGLRIGYAWTRNPWFLKSFRNQVSEPHFTLLYMLKRVYEDLNNGKQSLMSHLTTQRQILQDRAERLSEVLRKNGWLVLPSQGGLFLVAKPPQGFLELYKDKICETIFEKTEVLLNQPLWSGLTDYCRFVLSVDESIFEEALKRLSSIQMQSE